MKFKVLTCQAGIAAAMLAVAPASHADFLSDLFGSSAKEPAVLPLTTSQILQKKFIRSMDVKSLLGKLCQSPTKRGTRYNLVQKEGTGTLFGSQLDAGNVVTKNGKVALDKAAGVTFLKNGDAQFTFGHPKTPVIIDLNLRAIDVSGQKIADYLKTRDGKTSNDSEKVGNSKFPEGSIAYQAVTKFVNGEMVLPVNESFTNAKASREIIENFRTVPYCLNYESRMDSHAYGIVFDPSAPKATTGTYKILPVRRDTIFCKPTGEPAVASGNWNAVTTKNSSAVVLTLPSNVDPRDCGLKIHENGVAKIAFIAPAKGDHVFRPGRYYAKGAAVQGQNYLFNNVAADAATKALGL